MRDMMGINGICRKFFTNSRALNFYNRRFSSYVQGQNSPCGHREYFYYIDHQGMLFLDDAKMKNFTSCIKEHKFLRFFFKQMRFNDTARYERFPFVSLCAGEYNFIRCDDLPVVFTHLLPPSGENDNYMLAYGHAGSLLRHAFEPSRLCMLPSTGRVYHPGPSRLCGVGLVRSALAIEFSRQFEFRCGELAAADDDSEGSHSPSHFVWHDVEYELSNDIVSEVQRHTNHRP